MSHPVLWQFSFSHFNEKARWALDFKRVPHVRHSLLPGFHASKVKKMTGQTTVPVLLLDGETVRDSTRIIEALERAYPEPPLYPAASAERARALELEDFFDEELGPHIRRLAFFHLMPHPKRIAAMFSYDASPVVKLGYRMFLTAARPMLVKSMKIDEAGAELGRQKTLAALDRLERELGSSGYLVGDRFSVADLTGAALFSPLVTPPGFPYQLPGEPPEPLRRFRESIADRPGIRWVCDMYRQHRGSSAAVGSAA